jgi:hypothetical protein
VLTRAGVSACACMCGSVRASVCLRVNAQHQYIFEEFLTTIQQHAELITNLLNWTFYAMYVCVLCSCECVHMYVCVCIRMLWTRTCDICFLNFILRAYKMCRVGGS